MKIIASFLLVLLFLSCADKKRPVATSSKTDTSQVKDNTFNIDCTEPRLEAVITRSDTIIDYEKFNGHLIKSYDSQNRLRQTVISNLYENNADKVFSITEIYDSVGHLIYENKIQKYTIWHCYKYSYDNAGHLVSKAGYSSGTMGVKETYVYDGDSLVEKITERPGKITKEHFNKK